MANAFIALRRSGERGHADHGWLNTYHTFSFADYQDPRFMHWGSLRVLNEDRVAPQTGFPTHPHRDAEIFSYILSGELTHRDSMLRRGHEEEQQQPNGAAAGPRDDFYRMRRGDVQFTTGGTGIAHSETNEGAETVHFLQIWALPWRRGLTPRYHTRSFADGEKRKGFVTCVAPLAAGVAASPAEEEGAVPAVEGAIPVHADLCMGAAIVGSGSTYSWEVGSKKRGLQSANDRHVYVHFPMTKAGRAKVKIGGGEGTVLEEGDGAFVTADQGYELTVENVGDEDAEVIVLDSA